jgi:hypothetical protein
LLRSITFRHEITVYANRIKNTTSRENRAMDSVRANPRRAYPTSCLAMLGLRAAPLIREPNMTPRPAPTPARAMVAQPAPTILEAARMLMGLIDIMEGDEVMGRLEDSRLLFVGVCKGNDT